MTTLPVMKVTLFLIASLFSCALFAAGNDARPNILLIMVDDLAPVGSGFTGPVETPALDELAARGYLFTNNFSNVPVCGASRASMLGGIAPTAERFLTYNTRLDIDAPGTMSLPAFFKANGWYTLANGKIFDVIDDSAQGWSEPVWNPDNQWHSNQDVDERGEHLQKGYIEPVNGTRAPTYEKLAVEDEAYPDGQIALKSAADLKRLSESAKPFFLAVGFRKPHLPFNAPARYWTDEPAEIALPLTWHRSTGTIPAEATHRSMELRMQYDALPILGDPSLEKAQQIIAGYRAATRYADAQVGHVLRALTDNGLDKNTIVVVSGDHGFLLGEQRMWTKHALFEPALRTPLIIAAPSFAGGATVNAISDLLDVFPTLANLAGLPRPDHLDGHSLVPLLRNPSMPGRAEKPVSLSMWANGVSVRDAQYRYTRWHNKQNETISQMLFDLHTDPDELENIVAAPAAGEALAQLQDQLSKHLQEPYWSEALGKNVKLMSLANSSVGAALTVAMIYPLQTLVGVLLALIFLIVAVRRLIRG